MTEIYKYSDTEWEKFLSKYDYNYKKLICISNFNILMKKILINFLKLSDTMNLNAYPREYHTRKIDLINMFSNELILNETITIIMDIREIFVSQYDLYNNKEIHLSEFLKSIFDKISLNRRFRHHISRYSFLLPDRSTVHKLLNDLDSRLSYSSIQSKDIVNILHHFFSNRPGFEHITIYLNSLRCCCENDIPEKYLNILNKIDLDSNEDPKEVIFNFMKREFNTPDLSDFLGFDSGNFYAILNCILSDFKNMVNVCEKYFYLD